jgi:hypothetical protein
MSRVPSDKFRPFRSRSPRGRGGDEQVFVLRSASPLRHWHGNKERRNVRDRDRAAHRTKNGNDRYKHERGGGRDRNTKQLEPSCETGESGDWERMDISLSPRGP